mmetsp:Transcript_15543/g.13280  ORF Transcript_15543/g.13280 Transcript_15543/m.13280 type:complete len:288 (-) Transcript_15543:319-1182(-)
MKVFPYREGRPDKAYLNETRFTWLNHPNIINIVDFKDKRDTFHEGQLITSSSLLMEMAPYGSLSNLFRKKLWPKYDQQDKLARTLFHQLINGLEYLHEKKVGHLDIKPDNLLIGEDYKLKIADFDSASYRKDKLRARRGTINFMAPEVKYKQCENVCRADIYSAAIVLFICKAQTLPFKEQRPQEYHHEKSEGEVPEDQKEPEDFFEIFEDNEEAFWENAEKQTKTSFSSSFKELFAGMTKANARKRFNLEKVKESIWYNGPVYSDEELTSLMKMLLHEEDESRHTV